MRAGPVLLTLVLAQLLLSGCAGGAPRSDPFDRVKLAAMADPGAVVAADIAQNRQAQDIGVAAALMQSAAPDAIVLVPRPVPARTWLADAPAFPPTSWQPHEVHVSCDGSLAVTSGAIAWGGVPGFYTTIWQRQGNGRGDTGWRWVLSHGDGVERARTQPDLIRSTVARCAEPEGKAFAAAVGGQSGGGTSADDTLAYRWQVDAGGARRLVVRSWTTDGWSSVLDDSVSAP